MLGWSFQSLKNGLLLLHLAASVSSIKMDRFHRGRVVRDQWESHPIAPESLIDARTLFECAVECQATEGCQVLKMDGTKTCRLTTNVDPPFYLLVSREQLPD